MALYSHLQLAQPPQVPDPTQFHPLLPFVFCSEAACSLLVAVVGVSLNGANLYGYFKCSNAARSKIDTFQRNLAAGVVRNALSGGV
jgi:hypothetical protein